MTTLLAYHNDPAIKDAILTQLAAHREADELIKGKYWEGGKGCAVGCTIHSNKHAEYETRFGISQMLARLEDCIFEGLPNGSAKDWPERFMSAFIPGRDYSRVGWKFLHWLLTDSTINPGIEHELVRDAVRQCADIIHSLAKGNKITASAARNAVSASENAAGNTEDSAALAAWSAACAAESAAWSAACAANNAAWSAANNAAGSAAYAAKSAASAAKNVAWSAAYAAKSAVESAAYIKMSDKLIELIEATP